MDVQGQIEQMVLALIKNTEQIILLPFTAFPVRFEKMLLNLSSASMHIKQLADKTKYNIFIVASAKSAELFVFITDFC